MRFLMLRKSDTISEGGLPPSEKLIAAMERYHEELTRAGVMRAREELQSTAKGARITFSGGSPAVIDGPFAEAKELVAGSG